MKKHTLPLMKNNISSADLKIVQKYLSTKDPILTQSKKVREFEERWSNWLNVKYSVFVNSGSSANLITLAAMKYLYGNGDVMVPSLTWSSDIYSIFQNNLNPIFCDINLSNLSLDLESYVPKKKDKPKYLFLTHAQGFNGLSKKILDFCKKNKIYLIEDVCESHGASFNNKKLGSYGIASNFSFYYAHHMTTIEGGMISTNDLSVYQTLRMLRSHGLLRELDNESYKISITKKFKELNPEFIFMLPSFNVRNNEISALIGLNQLKRLDSNINKRNKNFNYFLDSLDNSKFFTSFDRKGISNYALNLILKEPNQKLFSKLTQKLKEKKIEFRIGSAGGGNQLRQPYMREFIKRKKINPSSFKNTEHVHFFGMYIGNYPDLTFEQIKYITDTINKI